MDDEVRLRPEVPVAAVLGLVNLRVPRAGAVLRRDRRVDLGGIDQCFDYQALGGGRGIDG